MDGEDSLPILKEEVEAAVWRLKLGKSPGVDNIPSELVTNGGEEVVKALTAIRQWIWEQYKWPKEWTQSLMIPLPKKGNLRQCENHRMISLISHPSKVMLCSILNCLKSKAEEILSEEQAGFRARQSTVEKIFNCRILIEKYLQHQRDLFHNFINFKKAIDWVWHDGLWHVLRGFNIEKGLTQVMQTLYDHPTSAVLLNNHLGEFFQMTTGIRQGCILFPTLFNCLWRESCKKPFMTTPLLSPLVADLSATYALQMISTSWWAVTVNCKNSPTKSLQQLVHMEWR